MSRQPYVAQVLLGIAAGAWLLTPDWIAASAAAGKWLDERGFKAEARYLLVCILAELVISAVKPYMSWNQVHFHAPSLLEEWSTCVQ